METGQLTQVKFRSEDHDTSDIIAEALGYKQTAYTDTSALWGLFCLPERSYYDGPVRGGCIIKTKELGFLFVQDIEDLQLTEEVSS